MTNILHKIIRFFTVDVWKHPSFHNKSVYRFFLRTYQILAHSIMAFIDDQCPNKAATLAFYTITSIVPFLAVIFGISKGFGLDEYLMKQLMQTFAEQKEILVYAIEFSVTLLNETKGGILVGVGVATLLWTFVALMGNVEDTFNQIWNNRYSRTLIRKFSDYFAIIIFTLLFVASTSSLNLYINTLSKTTAESYVWAGPLFLFILKFLPYFLSWVLFTYLYIVMPNGSYQVKPRIIAGVFAGTIFQLWQWFYIIFQLKISNYGAIYGSFAAIPLFFLWVQVSWLIILAGAELASHLENEIDLKLFTNDRFTEVTQKEFGIIVLCECVTAFKNGEPPITKKSIGEKLGISSLDVVQKILDILENGHLIIQVDLNDPEKGYLPIRDVLYFNIKNVSDVIENITKQVVRVKKIAIVKEVKKSFEQLNDHLNHSKYNKELINLRYYKNEE